MLDQSIIIPATKPQLQNTKYEHQSRPRVYIRNRKYYTIVWDTNGLLLGVEVSQALNSTDTLIKDIIKAGLGCCQISDTS